MIGKIKAIITRNFLQMKGGKYCVCKFGGDPSESIEVDECVATDAAFVRSNKYKETKDFFGYGCGVVCVAMVDESLFAPPKPVKTRTGRLKFDGNRHFLFEDGSQCDAASEVKFGKEAVEVVAA